MKTRLFGQKHPAAFQVLSLQQLTNSNFRKPLGNSFPHYGAETATSGFFVMGNKIYPFNPEVFTLNNSHIFSPNSSFV
jgi:hypothetical protein